MALSPSLQLRTSQHLALTPQLQQSIRLLQLSTLELSHEVEQMLLDNPFLERAQDDEPANDESGFERQADAPASAAGREAGPDAFDSSGGQGAAAADDDAGGPDAAPLDAPHDWAGDGSAEIGHDDGEWGGEAAPRGSGGSGSEADEAADAGELAHAQPSLYEFLHRQALSLRLPDEDRAALHFLIESLNEDGYLDETLEALAASLPGAGEASAPEEFDELVQRLRIALRLLQSLEPGGVGARDLGECLALQLRALEPRPHERAVHACALRICGQPLDLLARRDLRKLASICGADEARVRAAIALIGRLEPKPGRRFASVERNIVVPDVIVSRRGTGNSPSLRVQLNPDAMPRLKVHDIYANALRSQRGGTAAGDYAALQQRLSEARWFIKNIQQRFDTILRVAQAIVERQKSFFMHGALAMRPLVLREIAEELGLHESTISRVTTAKYMATPLGTFELKYFFGSALSTETGGNASSTAVRALIKQFIAAENPAKPLSDGAISDLLKEQGIECARRTVAKYREGLRIAPASLRRAL